MSLFTTSQTSFTPRFQFNPLKTLTEMVSVARQRRALAALDDRMLSDIGVTTHEVQTEVKRGFWDVPATWRV